MSKVLVRSYNKNDGFSPIEIENKLLNCTDLKKNSNKFYRIILQTNKNGQWRIYTNYGRVKDVTQIYNSIGKEECRNYEQSEIDARKDFKSLIKTKLRPSSGYVLIEIDNNTVFDKGKNKRKALNNINLNYRVYQFITQIYEEATTTLRKTILTPLGKLSKNQIDKAGSILKDIKSLVECNVSKDSNDMIELSNKFYSLVPHVMERNIDTNYYIISNINKIREKQELLTLMSDVEGVQSFLEASAYEKYLATGAKIELLSKDNLEWKRIEKYIQNTKSKYHNIKLHINNIFAIRIKGEEKFNSKKIDNIQELFHGSRNANVLGILQKGLLIKPSNIPTAGSMFGNGLYFADQSSKSTQYCCKFANNKYDNSFLFLADVALGKVKKCDIAQPFLDKAPRGYQSVEGIKGRQLLHNEYIIYDTNQVKLKYIVDFTAHK